MIAEVHLHVRRGRRHIQHGLPIGIDELVIGAPGVDGGKGAVVITRAGIIGTITGVQPGEIVVLEIQEKVRVRVPRAYIENTWSAKSDDKDKGDKDDKDKGESKAA